MNSERLQKWALGAEIAGGLAVVATLIAVAVELNQGNLQQELNTKALEIAAYQDLQASFNSLVSIIIEDQEFADLLAKANLNPDTIEGAEGARVSYFYGMAIRHGDMAYFQYEQGALSKDRLDSMLLIVFNLIEDSQIGMRVWNGISSSLSQNYVRYINDRL